MNTNTDYQSLDNFVRDKLRGVHTIKPGCCDQEHWSHS